MLLTVLVYFQNYANNYASVCKLYPFWQKNLEIMLLLFTLSLVKKKKTRGKLLCNRQINCKYIYPIYNQKLQWCIIHYKLRRLLRYSSPNILARQATQLYLRHLPVKLCRQTLFADGEAACIKTYLEKISRVLTETAVL